MPELSSTALLFFPKADLTVTYSTDPTSQPLCSDRSNTDRSFSLVSLQPFFFLYLIAPAGAVAPQTMRWCKSHTTQVRHSCDCLKFLMTSLVMNSTTQGGAQRWLDSKLFLCVCVSPAASSWWFFILSSLGYRGGYSANRHALPVRVSAEWWEAGSHRRHRHCWLCTAMCSWHW